MLKFRICQNQKIKNSCLTFFSMMYIFIFFPFKVVNPFEKNKNIKSLV